VAQAPVIYLLDASSYIHRAFHAIRGLSTSEGVPTGAVYGFTQMLLKVIKDAKPDYLAVVYDAKGPTFRHEMYPAYKANRPPLDPGLKTQFPLVRQVVTALDLPAVEMEGYEADDLMATLAAQAKEKGFEVVLVSGDKDLFQLVDKHITIWDTMKELRLGPEEVSEKLGITPEQVVDYMALTGDSLAELCGNGHLALTIDPGDGNERYQSIIELGRDTLSQALDNYFIQSEQLDTRLWLTASDRCAAGLLIQALPPEISTTPHDDDDIWNRVIHLSETLSEGELSDLPAMEILKRLYHEEDVRLFEAEQLYFHCRCNRENIADTLRSLGYAETQSIIDEQGVIKVECNFCKKSYEFDRVDNEALFAADRPHDLSTTRH